MRIALLYPPPWKIPAQGQIPDAAGDGPPAGHQATDIDPDFYQTPYGLLSLAAQAMRAGHQVKVINLSAFPWNTVEQTLAQLRADLFGMSCFTANRRGVALVARSLRRQHPDAHIVVGGPHASALPVEMLDHNPAIDTVVVGEGEETFLELVGRLDAAKSTVGIAGTVVRTDGQPVVGPPRERIADLDSLAPPHEYFNTHVVMTSRGCPGRCTFCAKNIVWGSTYRAHSVGYVLDMLEKAVARVPVRMLLVKDDTFTANRQRALEICQGIRDRDLQFIWSCDTRADVLTEELLRAMRLAGCQRLSLGVESGSAKVLKNIGKNLELATVVRATEMAKQFGLQVRFYMMLGNRGETAATFRESLAFIKRAQPHQYLFACLSVYPGTDDFRDLKCRGQLDAEAYFAEDFLELKMPFDASVRDTRLMSDWFRQNSGLGEYHQDGVEEYQAILERLGDYHAAHLDLGAAYYRAEHLDLAEQHVRRALDLAYPLPGLAHNYLACIAVARGNPRAAQHQLSEAVKRDPQHHVVLRNVSLLKQWLVQQQGGTDRLPSLAARHDFQLFERTVQPVLPGPLPHDFGRWT